MHNGLKFECIRARARERDFIKESGRREGKGRELEEGSAKRRVQIGKCEEESGGKKM
jgi:hypothetical protein